MNTTTTELERDIVLNYKRRTVSGKCAIIQNTKDERRVLICTKEGVYASSIMPKTEEEIWEDFMNGEVRTVDFKGFTFITGILIRDIFFPFDILDGMRIPRNKIK